MMNHEEPTHQGISSKIHSHIHLLLFYMSYDCILDFFLYIYDNLDIALYLLVAILYFLLHFLIFLPIFESFRNHMVYMR